MIQEDVCVYSAPVCSYRKPPSPLTDRLSAVNYSNRESVPIVLGMETGIKVFSAVFSVPLQPCFHKTPSESGGIPAFRTLFLRGRQFSYVCQIPFLPPDVLHRPIIPPHFKYTIKSIISLVRMPEMRSACPSVSGRTFSSLYRDSADNDGIAL